MHIERFSYKNSGNRAIGFCEISVCRFHDKTNVIVTEIPDNPGMSICNAFEDLFVQVCKFYDLDPSRVRWFEHWPKWTAEQGGYEREEEDWHQVDFELIDGRPVNARWRAIAMVA